MFERRSSNAGAEVAVAATAAARRVVASRRRVAVVVIGVMMILQTGEGSEPKTRAKSAGKHTGPARTDPDKCTSCLLTLGRRKTGGFHLDDFHLGFYKFLDEYQILVAQGVYKRRR